MAAPADPARDGEAPKSSDREDRSSSWLHARRCEKDTTLPLLMQLPGRERRFAGAGGDTPQK